MSLPILATKLHIPLPRPQIVHRQRLIEKLNAGLYQNQGFSRKLTLISAPAGFGKTTLLSEWIQQENNEKNTERFSVAWLSLDEGDNEITRFISYLIAALQTIVSDLGAGVISLLQSPQTPTIETVLTTLLNEIIAIPHHLTLVLDDYHVIDNQAVDMALAFLLNHLPPQMHLVIATREDPDLPLSRYRARDQLTELRAANLRFTASEAAEFLNQVMGLHLYEEDINALETRTEGWVAGLQMAALALQGLTLHGAPSSVANFIQAFTGSHHFILDYLLEEVLEQQPERVQNFLLRTSLLDRMCGPLCDALLRGPEKLPLGQDDSQAILEHLERANLFIVPLDSERYWYRYHHLFGDLLRQRAGQSLTPESIVEDHRCASQWYENNDLMFEAFHHAVLANDIGRAERLIESKTMPLHFHSVAMAIVDWLISLPHTVLDARPWLWVKSCTLALMAGQTSGVEERLQAAEEALQNLEVSDVLDDKIRDQIGQIACARATLALTHYQPEVMIIQARRAKEYLPTENLVFRFTAEWALTTAYFLQGDRAAAAQACQEALALSQKSGDIFSTVLATANMGELHELENNLHLAAETYRNLLPLFGDHPQPNAAEVYLGLARIHYEWNDLDAAEQYGEKSLKLARQYDRLIDRFIISEVFLARLKLAQEEVAGAAALLLQTEQTAYQKNFVLRMPEIAAVKVLILLQQGKLAAAAQAAEQYDLPLSQARVLLAQGDPAAALAILEPFRCQMETKGWADERLKAVVLQSVVLHVQGKKDQALQVLTEALVLAEPGGFIRLFVDEGPLMSQLLHEIEVRDILPEYTRQLLAAFSFAMPQKAISSSSKSAGLDQLSEREIEVLQQIAKGLTNEEIAHQLYISLYTVKAHVRNIFRKLAVTNRTQAVDRARKLGILQRN